MPFSIYIGCTWFLLLVQGSDLAFLVIGLHIIMHVHRQMSWTSFGRCNECDKAPVWSRMLRHSGSDELSLCCVSWKSARSTVLNVAVAVKFFFLLFVRVDADCFGFCVCVCFWSCSEYKIIFSVPGIDSRQSTGAVQLQWSWWTQLKSRLLFSLMNDIIKNRI